MKGHGFKRKGRVYYKEVNDIVFLLGTKAVGNYFAQVTGFSSCTFVVVEGFLIKGVDYWGTPVCTVGPEILLPDVFCTNALFHFNSMTNGYILRKTEHPYDTLNIPNPKEKTRMDLWLLPEEEYEQQCFLNEMQEQIVEGFLSKCDTIANDSNQLEEYSIGKLRQYNIERGYDENKPFIQGSYYGNYLNYLDYAVLFYKKYGPRSLYDKYILLLNNWRIANNMTLTK